MDADDESVEEFFSLFFHELTDSLRQSSTGVAGKSNQDYARRFGVADENKPAKVLVLRK